MVSIDEIKSVASNYFYCTDDLVVQELPFKNRKALLIYFNTMTDIQWLEQSFVNVISQEEAHKNNFSITECLSEFPLKQLNSITEGLPDLLTGSYIVIVENKDLHYFLGNAPKSNTRSIEEPINDRALRGSHAGFIEDLTTNINLIRYQAKIKELNIKKNIQLERP